MVVEERIVQWADWSIQDSHMVSSLTLFETLESLEMKSIPLRVRDLEYAKEILQCEVEFIKRMTKRVQDVEVLSLLFLLRVAKRVL
jgi:hypothetical protein